MKNCLFSLALLCATVAYSQEEASNWYFGYGAGISFSQTGAVSSVNGGQLETHEGCAALSDKFGNLLFYTDGTTVYNRENNPMPNGTFLFGHESSTQSAIIVPNPGSEDLYYVFTVDNALDGDNFGLNYSIVDMSEDSGLGGVTEKNIPLLQFSSEKLTAVRQDCISGNYWVLTLSTKNGSFGINDTYHAFEVSSEGVNKASIKSTFDIGSADILFSDSRGYLTISPDGTRLISANMQTGLFIYEFDTSTGVVSNQQKLNLDDRAPFPYGAAFSPNSKIMYIHSSNDFFIRGGIDVPSDHFSVLTQFDLRASNIQSSAYIVDERQLYRGALQLGPNGKIYRALSETYYSGLPYLGVINNPDALGANCNYQHNAVSLAPNKSGQGLPPFIQSIFDNDIDIINNGANTSVLTLCENDSYTLVADAIPNALYIWRKDGVNLNIQGNEHTVDTDGHYEVEIHPQGSECVLEGEAFVEIRPLPEVVEATLVQCDINNSDGLTVYNLEESIADLTQNNQDLTVRFYLNQQDAENNNNPLDAEEFSNVTSPQTLFAQVIDFQSGCYTISTLRLESQTTSLQKANIDACDDDGLDDGFYEFDLYDFNAQIPTGVNNGQQTTFYSSITDALLKRNNLPFNYTNKTVNNEIIYGRVDIDNVCAGFIEIELNVNPVPKIEAEKNDIYCLNFYPQLLTLDAGLVNDNPTNYTFQWSTGEDTAEIEVNQPGIYSVKVFNALGCFTERNIEVQPSDIASITNIDIEDASNNNSITIFVEGEGDYEYGLDTTDYRDENTFYDVESGIHTIYIRDKNNCGTIQRRISVIGFPKFFTPNDDGINDIWQINGVNTEFQPTSLIYIKDRYGKLLKKLDPLSKGWDGKFNGQVLPSSDYWFTVILEDGREFTGHFSLRR